MIDKLKKIIKRIKQEFINIFPSILIGGFCGLLISIYNFKKDLPEIIINNKEITQEDKIVFNEHLNANGKDIIIILDVFNFNRNHGNKVSNYLNLYLKDSLKKQDKSNPIKIITLSYDEQKYNIENINLYLFENKNMVYEKINKEIYQLEKYISVIRELNPNSKIVLSSSIIKFFVNDKIIELSKKYNLKLAQSYPSDYKSFIDYEFLYLILYYLLDKTNTITVSTQDFKPLPFIKQISLDDINHNLNIINKYYSSTSILTPILAYEYYLNKETNIVNKDLLKSREKEFK